jgi:hypothetical protein
LPYTPASARSVSITTPPPLLCPTMSGRTPSRSYCHASMPASVRPSRSLHVVISPVRGSTSAAAG